jgi:hypothetical protein
MSLPSRGTVVGMKEDTAESFAAVAEGLDPDQIHRVVTTFLAWLARCPVCDGVGTITVGNGVRLPLMERGRENQGYEHHYVAQGVEIGCPRCGTNNGEALRADPEFVSWHCFAKAQESTCQTIKANENESAYPEHANCGYRVMLPVPKDDE